MTKQETKIVKLLNRNLRTKEKVIKSLEKYNTILVNKIDKLEKQVRDNDQLLQKLGRMK